MLGPGTHGAELDATKETPPAATVAMVSELRQRLEALFGIRGDMDVKSIEALSLGPRDVLVVRLADRIPRAEFQRLADQVYGVLVQAGLTNKVLVLDSGASLEVLRVENESPAAGENGS